MLSTNKSLSIKILNMKIKQKYLNYPQIYNHLNRKINQEMVLFYINECRRFSINKWNFDW